jgi:predicted nucleic acid-binding protein
VAVLVDTSGLLALLDADDRHHVAIRSTVEERREPLVVPLLVLPEANYLVATRLGVRTELAMLEAVVGGQVSVEAPSAQDLRRCLELIQQYADSDIGLVDASIVATAERLGITRLLTLDHRHFRMIRPRHCVAFDILPSE